MNAKVEYYNPSATDFTPGWVVIDAKNEVLGRLATGIAMALMGKDKPTYVPHLLSGDFVIVINARHVRVTGNKATQKVYKSHNTRMGGLKEVPYSVMLERHPDNVIRHAVKGMLPKNKLSSKILRRLKVYADETHPHSAQVVGWQRRKLSIEGTETEHTDASSSKGKTKPTVSKTSEATDTSPDREEHSIVAATEATDGDEMAAESTGSETAEVTDTPPDSEEHSTVAATEATDGDEVAAEPTDSETAEVTDTPPDSEEHSTVAATEATDGDEVAAEPTGSETAEVTDTPPDSEEHNAVAATETTDGDDDDINQLDDTSEPGSNSK